VDYATKEITPTHGQPIFYNALEFTIELVWDERFPDLQFQPIVGWLKTWPRLWLFNGFLIWWIFFMKSQIVFHFGHVVSIPFPWIRLQLYSNQYGNSLDLNSLTRYMLANSICCLCFVALI
jgi:hypothetical protein